MTKQTTTPGPWEVIGAIQGYSKRVEIRMVPTNYYASDGRPSAIIHGENAENNAHLMAAAPEMLDTLKYVFSAISRVEGKEDEYRVLAPKSTIDKIAKAIGKAERHPALNPITD